RGNGAGARRRCSCSTTTPSVELVEEGVNGFVAPSASAEDLAAAIVRVREAGDRLRESTLAWFQRNAERLALVSSLEIVTRSCAAPTWLHRRRSSRERSSTTKAPAAQGAAVRAAKPGARGGRRLQRRRRA